MKLLVISPVLPPLHAGEADYGYRLADALVASGSSVVLLASRPRGDAWAVPAGVRLRTDVDAWNWRSVPAVMRCLREERPDAVLLLYLGWIFDGHPMATYLPWLAKRVLPSTRFVTLFYNRIGASEHANPVTTRLARKVMSRLAGRLDACYEFGTLLRASDEVLVLAEKHGDFLVAQAGGGELLRSRLKVVPPPPLITMAPVDGAERDSLRRELGAGASTTLLVFFGYLREGKGLETLIPAVARLRRQRDVRLVVVGGSMDPKAPAETDYARTLAETASNAGVADAIRFEGAYDWSSTRPSRLLSAADIAVLPYDIGVAANNSSLAAALAHGLPVVTTRGEQLEAFFRPDENVALCPPRDVDALASTITRVMDDASLRERLRRGAASLAKTAFSWENTVTAFLHAARS